MGKDVCISAIYSGGVRHSSAGFKMLSTTHDPRKCAAAAAAAAKQWVAFIVNQSNTSVTAVSADSDRSSKTW